MPGVVARQTTPIDPHTGLPQKPYAQTYAEGQAAQRAQQLANQARSNENSAREQALADAQRAQRMGISGSTGYTGAQGTVQYSSNGMPGGSAATRSSGAGAGAAGGTGPRQSIDMLLADYNKISPEVPRAAAPSRADRTAANDAAYGAAKAKIGLQNRASLNSLRNVMSERNISGSGIEGAGIASVVAGGNHNLSDAVLQQTGADLSREQNVEDRNYTGDVQQRGQDLSAQAAKRAALEELFRMRTGTGYASALY